MATKEDIDQLLQARSEIDDELRRHKTKQIVLFTDIVGSTTYFDRFGDTAGLLLLYRHDRVVVGAVEEFKGVVIKTIGDSVMAQFADPLQAVNAAIAMQQRLQQHNLSFPNSERVQIRIGIHFGLGFRRANDLFGDTVNVAARITKRSGAAQILVSQAIAEMIPATDVMLRSLGKVNLEGKAEAEELYEVVWTEASAYDALRGSLSAISSQAEGISQSAPLDAFVQQAPMLSELADLSSSSPLPLSMASRYEVLNRLGAGGMGVVYKARDRETGETVALKVLNPAIVDQATLMDVFKNEIRVARKITHKNVCRIYDFARSEGTAFISMEFIQGETLRRVLDRFVALTPRKGIKVAQEICDALREVHLQGIVHRDLKPQNLMIDETGNVKLMDFGLAHLVADGSTAAGGTPSYMAPEQAKGGPIDQRADIYSLGLVLFEIFTGAAAFSGNSPMVVALKQLYDAPPNPSDVEQSMPEHVARAILRCLEKDPADRFQNIDELRAVLTLEPVAPRPAVAYRRIISIGVVLLMLAGGMIASRADTKRAVVQVEPVPQQQVEIPPVPEIEPTIISPPESPVPAPVKAAIPAAPKVAPAPKPDPQPAALPNRRPDWQELIETVSIPAGVFMMGDESGKGDEKPRHQVRVDGFDMSRTEITNRQYLAFLTATGYQRPKDPTFAKNYLMDYPDLPVVNVSYEDAVAFCAWASTKFEAIVRLPTEAEWEYASTAGEAAAPFPWGAQDPKTMARFKGNSPRGVATVSKDAFPANRFGLSNMSGNVWEWVMDFYAKDYYSTSPIRNPKGPAAGTRRSIRGGSWADDEQSLSATRRANRNPSEHSDQVGFRIVVTRPPADI